MPLLGGAGIAYAVARGRPVCRSISALPAILPSAPLPVVAASDAQLRDLEGYYASYDGVNPTATRW